MEFRLVLVRHGETSHNKESVIQGHLDVPLSAHGIRQAKCLGLKYRLKGQSWKEVWTSDLKRAWQTANFILGADCEDDDQLLLQPLSILMTDQRIRERFYGTVQGLPLSDLKKMADEAGTTMAEFTPPEAESLEEMRMRAISFFHALCVGLKEQGSFEDPILIVSHGGWLRELVGYLCNRAAQSEELARMRSKVGRICPNTGVTSFEIKLSEEGIPQHIRCTGLHDRSHLDGATENHSSLEMAF